MVFRLWRRQSHQFTTEAHGRGTLGTLFVPIFIRSPLALFLIYLELRGAAKNSHINASQRKPQREGK